MGSKEGRGPHADKTPAAKSLYRSIFLEHDIWHYILSVQSFYAPPLSVPLTQRARYKPLTRPLMFPDSEGGIKATCQSSDVGQGYEHCSPPPLPRAPLV